MERAVTFEEGEFYHIYNRGIDKRKIFFSAGDWKHFQRLLYIRNTDSDSKINLSRIKDLPLKQVFQGDPGTLVDICAYAMMDNHFHLLVKEVKEGGITQFMMKFMTSYSMYMNKKYDRTGPLMCKPFRTKHVETDDYFRWLLSYIHLNPLDQVESGWKEKGIRNKKAAITFLQQYKYSSYFDYYVEDRDESVILNKEALPIGVEDLENIDAMIGRLKKEPSHVLG